MLKTKDFVVCIDSDGCAMDTMNYKHFEFFGPLAADEWSVPLHLRDEFLKTWNDVNLFTMTRGVNRFKGLYITYEKMSSLHPEIKELKYIKKWCLESTKLSNGALEELIKKLESSDDLNLEEKVEYEKALNWSLKVNEGISNAHGKDKPYEAVLETLKLIKQRADIVIVSSANHDALMAEWTNHGLMDYVNEVMSQNQGSKAECIAKVLEAGYDKNNLIMLGDSPGDLDAAKHNSVFFYPILVNSEKESWEDFANKYFEDFLATDFSKDQAILNKKFTDNLTK